MIEQDFFTSYNPVYIQENIPDNLDYVYNNFSKPISVKSQRKDTSIQNNKSRNFFNDIYITESSALQSPEIESHVNDFAKLSLDLLLELYPELKLKFRITEGKRSKNATYGSKNSYHKVLDLYGNSMAYDIVPSNGDFDELINLLKSHEGFNMWAKSHGFKVNKEITKTEQRKTKATGAHLHIAPESFNLAYARHGKKLIKKQYIDLWKLTKL